MSRIILFRFHKDLEIARERVKILQLYNPRIPIHALYGGEIELANEAEIALRDYVESFWVFPELRKKDWKWMHTDLMTKSWYKDVGSHIEFDHLYSYEYDLLTLAPLQDIYPNVMGSDIALSAAEIFTKQIEENWYWTSKEPALTQYKKYCEYMKLHYNLDRQSMVCLGPGPLLSKEFLRQFSAEPDSEFVHEELTLPAYAEIFGIHIKNTGMHPGFFAYSNEDKYFSCVENAMVPWKTIQECLRSDNSRRSFHPVKYMVTKDSVEKLGV